MKIYWIFLMLWTGFFTWYETYCLVHPHSYNLVVFHMVCLMLQISFFFFSLVQLTYQFRRPR